MTDKELKKLRRGELLDLLIYQTEQNRKLREELDDANDALICRDIYIENAGSLAEASAQIGEVFESADKAAKIYLDNIERRVRETDEACNQKIADAERRAAEIIAEAQRAASQSTVNEEMKPEQTFTNSVEV